MLGRDNISRNIEANKDDLEEGKGAKGKAYSMLSFTLAHAMSSEFIAMIGSTLQFGHRVVPVVQAWMKLDQVI